MSGSSGLWSLLKFVCFIGAVIMYLYLSLWFTSDLLLVVVSMECHRVSLLLKMMSRFMYGSGFVGLLLAQ